MQLQLGLVMACKHVGSPWIPRQTRRYIYMYNKASISGSKGTHMSLPQVRTYYVQHQTEYYVAR